MHFSKQNHRHTRGALGKSPTAVGLSGRLDRDDLPRSLREQIDRAVVVQQSLLPDVSESVGGFRLAAEYLPCESLAGDFYDICRRPRCVTLMVSDVMGHGVEAALLTPILKAVFQETASSISDPGALLKEMNERLHGLIPDETDRRTVHDVNYDELCQGEVRRESRARYLEIVGRLRTQGAEGVILGCTEIGLLIGQTDLDIPVFDSTEAHAAAAAEAALAD